MEDSDSYRRGSDLRHVLYGTTSNSAGDTTANLGMGMQRFGDLVRTAILGTLWVRPGLDLKMRTFICVITDVAMGIEEELAIHIQMAMRQGWTEVELIEAILHAGSYSGIPRARQAILVADRTFAQIREQAGQPSNEGAFKA